MGSEVLMGGPDLGGICIHEQIAACVQRDPNRIAVLHPGGEATYGDLWRRVVEISEALLLAGAGKGDAVGVCLDRGLDLVAGLLAVLRSGAAYVPLDPAFPGARIEYMLGHSRAKVLVTTVEILAKLPSTRAEPLLLDSPIPSRDVPAPMPHLGPSDLAQVIYTSGSTGLPKGVEIEHGALANLMASMRDWPGITREDVLHSLATVSFDIAGLELFLPLTVGARVVIAPREVSLDPVKIIASLKAKGATIVQATPVTWRMLVDAGWDGSPPVVALSGGEALPVDLARELLSLGADLWNLYGPTETTIYSTGTRVSRPEDAAFIGTPVRNTRLHVLDATLGRVDIDIPGELFIGGAGLARGYRDAPAMTAERFLEYPLGSGERVYRTGDLVRRTSDGRIEYLGRIDNQVKIRGYRIELGEIETRLEAFPGIAQAVVVARDGHTGEKRLVAYFTCAEGADCAPEQLSEYLREALPRYMIPAAWVRMAAFPLTENRKIDRKLLPEPDTTAPAGEPPRDACESEVVAFMSEVLGVRGIGRNDNFFDLGGDSLQAVRLRACIEDRLGVHIEVGAIFAHPTVAGLAAFLLGQERVGRASIPLQVVIGEPADGDVTPLSRAQQRVWLLSQFLPHPGVLNVHAAWRFRGPLAFEAFSAAFADTIERHSALSMVLGVDGSGRPTQRVERGRGALQVVDFSGIAHEERESRMLELATRSAAEPFDTERPPLWRAILLRASPTDHLFVLVIHHIVSDQRSFDIFLRDFELAYRARSQGAAPELPGISPGYAQYAVLDSVRSVPPAAPEFWRAALRDAPQAVAVPADYPRPLRRSFAGESVTLRLPASVAMRLRAFAHRESTTLYHLCLAAWTVVLARYSGQRDLVIGTPASTRDRPELAEMAGFFVNMLPVRVRVPETATLAGVMGIARDAAVAALEYSCVDFEEIVRASVEERSAGLSPLFNCALSFLRADDGGSFADLYRAPVSLDSAFAQYELFLWLTDTESGLCARLEFATDVFARDRMDRMLAHFETVLERLLEAPSTPVWAFPLLSGRDRAEIGARWDAVRRAPTLPLTLPGMFGAQVACNPRAIAVVHEGLSLDYATLMQRSRHLAVTLRTQGAGPGKRVLLFVDRGPGMVVALLAILQSGAAYVPMDPVYPADRIAYVLDDSRAALVVTERALADSLPPFPGGVVLVDGTTESPDTAAEQLAEPDPDSAAYVLYTSGSTGNPKGVEVSHRALANFLRSMSRRPGLSRDDCMLALTTIAFDIAGLEIYLPLAIGARIAMVSRRLAIDGIALQREIDRDGVTVIQATPATFRLLLAAGWTGSPHLRVLCGGEALPAELAARLAACCTELWNMYGPTETTIWSTCERIADPTDITIGLPIDNTDVLVVDPHGNVQPTGLEGELLIGGEGLAIGYLGRPELTAEKFVAHPLRPGDRVYRTGDRGFWRLDGKLVCLGRIDHQIKLRGYRIEPGEIEARLATHPSIGESVVVLADDGAGDKCLAAYLVPRDGHLIDGAALRAHLRNRLPDYMIPTAWMSMASLPLTPNGKIDRRALPPPTRNQKCKGMEVKTADVRTRLIRIFESVLGVPLESPDDDFFAIGGHSLTVLTLVSQVNEAFGTSLEPVVLFERPTVNLLAQVLDGDHGSADLGAAPVATAPSGVDNPRVDAILGAIARGAVADGSPRAPMREHWLCRAALAPAYGIRRGSVRRLLTRMILKLEGGALFSVTMRKLFAKHHDIFVGDYTGVEFSAILLKEKTRIGRYCSIYPTVTFQNAEHPRNTVSTHGIFYHRALGLTEGYELERAQIEVGHDVWIGDGAKILYPTRKIGTGAIIAANAVIVGDVPPYAIVGGYPARVLRYRFSRETIDKLLASRWWEMSPAEIYPVREQFARPLEGDRIR